LLDQGHSAKDLGYYGFLVKVAAIAFSKNKARPCNTNDNKEERSMEDRLRYTFIFLLIEHVSFFAFCDCQLAFICFDIQQVPKLALFLSVNADAEFVWDELRRTS
jgi:hypothetical protein